MDYKQIQKICKTNMNTIQWLTGSFTIHILNQIFLKKNHITRGKCKENFLKNIYWCLQTDKSLLQKCLCFILIFIIVIIYIKN